jgi:hypothetical protein
MKSDDNVQMKLATTSPEEGLDFACNLVAAAVSREAKLHPERAAVILGTLTQYIEFRYVGELQLAAECLADLGRDVSSGISFRREHFWAQMQWVARSMGLPEQEYSGEPRSDENKI